MMKLDRRTTLKLLAGGAGMAATGGTLTPSGAAAAESDKTLCEQLAEYVVSLRFESIPRATVAKARDVILHNLAVAFGGVGTDQVNKAVEFVETRSGTATIIGQSFKASPADAAFVNTIATRALRMEDTHAPSFTHPGACLVPTALAVSEQRGASGGDLLTALIAGFDVIGKVAGSLSTSHFRAPSHIFGALGVAATAAKLMRLDVVQTAGALAHACNLGAMIGGGLEDFQYGILTRNGIFAAALGRCRAPFPRDALEGPYGLYAVQLRGERPATKEILGALGSRYEIMTTMLKPHPCTGVNLVALEMVRKLIRDHGLTNDNVRRVHVRRSNHALPPGHDGVGPFGGYMNGMYEATPSLPFAIAVLLVDGKVTLAHFSNPNDPRLVPAMRKVVVEVREGLGLLDHEVTVERANGEVLSLRGADEFLTTPDAAEILRVHGRPVVGEAKVRELERSVAMLASARDVTQLAKCLA